MMLHSSGAITIPRGILPTNRPPSSVDLQKEEDVTDYRPGGYCPIHVWDSIKDNRYIIVRKLGWGHFSTVWLAKDNQTHRHVALKIVKCSPKYAQTALDEISLLRLIAESPNPTHIGRPHIVEFLDSFELPSTSTDLHGRPVTLSHVCMTFEPLGETLLSLLKRLQTCDKTNLKKGIPAVLVKQIAKQMLLALDFLHDSCGLVHTDIKPENVMVAIEDVEEIVKAEMDAAGCFDYQSPPAADAKVVTIPKTRTMGSMSGFGGFNPSSGSHRDRHNGWGDDSGRKVSIFGSQPLPSPSQSWGSRDDLEKLSLRMSKLQPPSLAPTNGAATPPREPLTPSSTGTSCTSSSTLAISTAPTSYGTTMKSPLNTGASREGQTQALVIPSEAPQPKATSLTPTQNKSPAEHESSPSRPSAPAPTPSQSTTTLQAPDRHRKGHSKSPSLLSQTAPFFNKQAPSDSSSTISPSLNKPSSNTSTSTSSADTSPSSSTLLPPRPSSSSSSSASISDAEQSLPALAMYLPPPPSTSQVPRIRIKIADLGNATPKDRHYTHDIQTRQYRCPEVILGWEDWGCEVDLWGVACMIFELMTSDYLFAPKHKPGDYSKDDDHMAQIIELLGDLPDHRKHGGNYSKQIFRSNGKLRNIKKLRPWCVESVLREKYDYDIPSAQEVVAFLLPMLRVDPAERASAGEMVRHPWLDLPFALEE